MIPNVALSLAISFVSLSSVFHKITLFTLFLLGISPLLFIFLVPRSHGLMYTVGCKENVKSLYWRNLCLYMKVLSCLVDIQVKLAQEGLKCKSIADSSIKRWVFFPYKSNTLFILSFTEAGVGYSCIYFACSMYFSKTCWKIQSDSDIVLIERITALFWLKIQVHTRIELWNRKSVVLGELPVIDSGFSFSAQMKYFA